MTWRDLPVTSTIDQLLPGFVVNDAGDCVSKYVSNDSISNEVFFTFAMPPDSDSMPGPLRLCVHYCADDPLDFDQLLSTSTVMTIPSTPVSTNMVACREASTGNRVMMCWMSATRI